MAIRWIIPSALNTAPHHRVAEVSLCSGPSRPLGPIFQSHKLWVFGYSLSQFSSLPSSSSKLAHGNPSNSLGTATLSASQEGKGGGSKPGGRKERGDEVFFSQTFMIWVVELEGRERIFKFARGWQGIRQEGWWNKRWEISCRMVWARDKLEIWFYYWL